VACCSVRGMLLEGEGEGWLMRVGPRMTGTWMAMEAAAAVLSPGTALGTTPGRTTTTPEQQRTCP